MTARQTKHTSFLRLFLAILNRALPAACLSVTPSYFTIVPTKFASSAKTAPEGKAIINISTNK